MTGRGAPIPGEKARSIGGALVSGEEVSREKGIVICLRGKVMSLVDGDESSVAYFSVFVQRGGLRHVDYSGYAEESQDWRSGRVL